MGSAVGGALTIVCKDSCKPTHDSEISFEVDTSSKISSYNCLSGRRRTCKYGQRCYRHDAAHLAEFAHLGDPDYEPDVNEMLETIWAFTRDEVLSNETRKVLRDGYSSDQAISDHFHQIVGDGALNKSTDSRSTAATPQDLLTHHAIEHLSEGTDACTSVVRQFQEKWQPSTWSDKISVSVPQIRRVYAINVYSKRADYVQKQQQLAARRKHGSFAGKGNECRRFHGTRLKCNFQGIPCKDPDCSACRIIQSGRFALSKSTSRSSTATYGNGIYFTTMSHTAKGYGLAQGKQRPPRNVTDFISPGAGNAVIMALVLIGRPEIIEGFGKDAAEQDLPPLDYSQYDSRLVKKKTGNDELVIFNESQAIPRYLLIFD